MENYILRSVSLVFISVMIGCSTDPEIKKEDSFRYLTEADLKKTDFPAATQFKCPEDTQTVYGWSCPTNNVLASANAEGSSWQEIKCNTDFVYTNICVDKYEYPGVHSVPEKVSLEEAKNICMARDGHLCSQQEWRNSCTGNIKSPYGMSNFKRPEECNFDKPRKSGFNPGCRNVHGVVDMIGNGAEWQTEGTIGLTSCLDARAATENKNSFRCCYNPTK